MRSVTSGLPRQPGPPPSGQAVKRLRLLLDAYQRATVHEHDAHDDLCLELVRIREAEGLSVQAVANALGVSTSTVQHWTRHGRRLRSD